MDLNMAGKYTHKQVMANKSYYDNKKETCAIPYHVANKFVMRIVSSDVNVKALTGMEEV